MHNLKSIMTPVVKAQIESKASEIQNAIFVFVGIDQFVDMSSFADKVVDPDTFTLDGNATLFNNNWFGRVFPKLLSSNEYLILSFAQFSYLLTYIQPEFIKPRVFLIRDGLRALLPLDKNNYIEKSGDENIEARPEDMPLYMAEQIQIGTEYYYTTNLSEMDFAIIDLFSESHPIEVSTTTEGLEVIDTVSDIHGIDLFINRCLASQNFDKRVVAKMFKKQPMKDRAKNTLEKLNWLLHKFGGEMFEIGDIAIEPSFTPKEDTLSLLHKYWGPDAKFRDLNVYADPASGKEIVDISQGLIVEKIIDEYNKGRDGKDARDLFMTASTGAGKSLMFQLPAFFASENNDVTIVISPLISLMKDQVEQIRTNRGYQKAYFINSELSLIDRDRVIEQCKNGDVDILYLSPELLLSYDITFFIGERHLGLMVIDEAHLITTWGRDFRVDYWFLGQHIDKIRKNYKAENKSFPVVAFTATAVYGGDNDMVFDSLNSLYMHDPYIFIGEVKRNDITFVIDNHDPYMSDYDENKQNETVKFIKDIADANVKTIVYAPYRKHIDIIQQKLDADDSSKDVAVSYHSGLTADEKNFAFNHFKNNEAKVMISTKAFGMGVDISDVQLVYHHAPSGLLPDYVQEIGRAARKPGLNGFAALSYAEQDQRYSKMLHGMSALRQYQLREVLNKIYKTYKANGNKRNMLVSTSDFAYIFGENMDEDGQKLMTALMMIEKDYLAKYRYNVVIARPKKLFVKVFCGVTEDSYRKLNRKYNGMFRVLQHATEGGYIVELDLDKVWQEHFYEKSFPLIKKNFYSGELMKDDNIRLNPKIRLTFNLETDVKNASNDICNLLDNIQHCFVLLNGNFFKQSDFDNALSQYIKDDAKREKIVKFILATYSNRYGTHVEEDAFLQCRRRNSEEEYRIFNIQYTQNFNKIKRRMQKLFEGRTDRSATRFVSNTGEYLLNYVRLGSLMEIIGIGSYESSGGDNPMVFIRLNEPRRVASDASDKNYNNHLLSNIKLRYKTSTHIFDHFFLNSFGNDQRWNFIEDFFLGESEDELKLKYEGGSHSHVDIVEYVKEHSGATLSTDIQSQNGSSEIDIFAPKMEGYYDNNNMLAYDGKTLRISKWISDDPVALDKVRREYKFKMTREAYDVLQSKLRNHHYTYYRDVMGLGLFVTGIPGYENGVVARIPYESDPVKFYKWWHNINEDKVTMSKAELYQLLVRVYELKPKALVKKHKEWLESRK